MSSIHVLSLEIMFVVCSGIGNKLEEGEGARLIQKMIIWLCLTLQKKKRGSKPLLDPPPRPVPTPMCCNYDRNIFLSSSSNVKTDAFLGHRLNFFALTSRPVPKFLFIIFYRQIFKVRMTKYHSN